jgi:cation diffusion facilitator family transporter
MNNPCQKLAYTEGAVSIAVNIVLFVLKYWVGLTTGSIAIMADAWHTLSDSLTSVVVIFGARISHKPADKEHPFGHGRAESIASVIIGVMLFMVGCNFMLDAFGKLKGHETAQFSVSAIIIFTLSVIIKEAMAQFAMYAYRKTGASSLKADGWHHRSDAIASAVILIGIFMTGRLWWIDAVFGMAVSLLIIYTAVEIVKEAVAPILGSRPDQRHIEMIHDLARKHSLQNVHRIRVHSYGSRMEYTLHACLPEDVPIGKAHDAADRFEQDLRDTLGIHALIHIEPYPQATDS